ncbi:MAG: carbohydrate porin, partial [Cetobacterium sp.]
ETQVRYGLSVAPTFTVDSDYFGRPQIQPFVTWVKTNFDGGFGGDLSKEKSQVLFGVKSEVWF